MFIAKVRGNVVVTQKVPAMIGHKLLIVDPQVLAKDAPEMVATGRSFVAIDTVGAGVEELVLVTMGSSARMTDATAKVPVDCVIIGIIDSVNAEDTELYKKGRD